MADPRQCPQCRQPIPATAPEGACPTCLVGLAVEVGSATSRPAGPFQPPAVEELNALFDADDLRVQALLGCGGMGAVYRAVQERLDRVVALKVLPPARARDVLFAERFLREARALAKLRHPHIVGVYDAGRVKSPGGGELLYIVMEFVDGASLRDLIRDGQLSPGEAMRLVPQVCDAMQYAHDRGVVHRDIKPENILVDENGTAKVADFGLAKLAGSESKPATVLTEADDHFGTPRYMAPEQMAASGRADHRADIYSLGVMFYEMLTGDIPVADYTPPSDRADVDPRVDRVVERSIKRSPDERYQKAAEVKRDVEGIAASPRRRHGIGRWAAAGVAVAVVAVALVFLGLRNRIWGPPASAQEPGGSTVVATVTTSTTTTTTTTPVRQPDRPGVVGMHPLLSPDWEWTEPQNLGAGVNTSGIDMHPAVTADGRTLVFVRDWRAWQSRRASALDPFGEAEQLPGPVNDAKVDAPYLSADGLTMWFASPRRGSLGQNDLWECRRPAIDRPFGEPVNLGDGVNTDGEESTPFVSADGLTLLYCAIRDGGGGLADLYVATRRTTTEPFGRGRLLGGSVNGPGNDFFPRMTADGRALLYTSTIGVGDQRLRISTRPTPAGDFGPPADLPAVVNTGIVSGASLSPDGTTLYFDAARPDGLGKFDLWVSRRVSKRPDYVLELDGAASYVSIPSLRRDDPGPVTVEAWVRPRRQQTPRPRAVFVLGGLARCQLNHNPSGLLAYDMSVAGNEISAGPATSGGAADPDRLIHLAYVVDDAEGRLYVDGVEAGRSARTGPRTVDSHKVTESWIGGHPEATEPTVKYHFRGQVDEIRVSRGARYDRTFSPTRRFESDALTLALYHCDEGGGTVLKDASGHGHDGTAVGVKWALASKPPPSVPAVVATVVPTSAPTSAPATRPTTKPTTAPADGNWALEFDGRTSRVSFPTLKRDEPGPITIEAWAAAPRPASPTVVFTLGGKADCSLNLSQKNWFANDIGITGQYLEKAHAGPDLVHLAYVADAGEGRFYLNGVEVQRSPLAKTRPPSTTEGSHAWLGATETAPGTNRIAYFFKGRIDEVRVSSIARYDKPFTPRRRFEPDAHTLALYHCDEGTGEVLKDASGHNHHGKVTAATWVPAAADAGR